MLDMKLFRHDITALASSLASRGFTLDVAAFDALEEKRKSCQQETQALQTERNASSKAIGQAKARGEDIAPLVAEVGELGDRLVESNHQLQAILSEIDTLCLSVPNVLEDSIPAGLREEDNVVLSHWGEPFKFAFEPKDHIALGALNRGIDFEAGAALSGSRFVVLRKDMARLHRALGQFMLDLHTQKHGYEETYVPYLVKSECLYGTGQLPKFKEDQFECAGDHDLTLIPTAEVPLTNLFRDKIVSADALPIKLVAHTPCFRSEAGSYGKDTAGMIRQHQFEKVELVQLVSEEQAESAFSDLCSHAEAVLQALKLPYRRVALCGGDTAFSAAKTYDLEVWLPGQQLYREISSCSYCRDFQARRMSARYRGPDGKPLFLHTVNGSGVAIGRALIAVVENYQLENGRIAVPDALQTYLSGAAVLGD